MTTPLDGWGVMERALEFTRAGEAFALATVVWRKAPSSGQHGSRAIVTAGGELFGWIGGACAEPVIIREAQKAIQEGSPRLVWLGQPDEFEGMHVPNGVMTVPMSCQSEGALQIYIEPSSTSPHLVIVGRSPMAVTLSEMASLLDWHVDLVDGGEFTAGTATNGSVVVIATQGHGDEDVLETAIGIAPAYLGVVASAKRSDALRGYLADRGFDRRVIDAIRMPVGLDLGHTTHREVAVAVLAELVQRRAAGEFPVAAAVAAQRPDDVVDPVCGMTVAADPANYPVDHDGRTFYFCCPGCRYSFKKDPDSFLSQEVSC
ncbi:MAG: XdhC family protein [Ilumatobacteraceae bacterium]